MKGSYGAGQMASRKYAAQSHARCAIFYTRCSNTPRLPKYIARVASMAVVGRAATSLSVFVEFLEDILDIGKFFLALLNDLG